MKACILFRILFWVLLISPLCTIGQEMKKAGKIPADTPSEHPRQLYKKALQGQTFLFNGAEYDRFQGHAENHPFFEHDYFQIGSVHYEGEQYDSIPILFDVFIDQLIISHLDQAGHNAAIQLHKERVRAFQLNGRYFIHLSADTLTGDHSGSGFYNLLHDGEKTKLLLKRHVNKTESYDANLRNFKTSFSKKDRFFLFHKGSYHAVKSRRSVLKVLDDQRKNLAQHIRQSDLNFRKRREQAILEVVQEYEKLKKKHD